MKTIPLLKLICFCTLVGLCAAASVPANKDKSITGTWVVNEEATDALQSKVRKSNPASRGIGSATGGVLGIPVPSGSGPSGPNSTLKFPIVLECKEISFEVEDEAVKVSCASGVSREFLIGKIHGRTTRFRRNVLTESYSSTSRSVKHDIRVDKKGNLVAKVKIKPKNGVSQTYVRVYSRPTEIEPQEDETETDVEAEAEAEPKVEISRKH